MKKIIIIVIVVVALGVTLSVAVANWVYQDNNDRVTELFIGNVQGVTAQDIKLCDESYLHGGKYYHRIGNVALTCEYNHISVDFNEE